MQQLGKNMSNVEIRCVADVNMDLIFTLIGKKAED